MQTVLHLAVQLDSGVGPSQVGIDHIESDGTVIRLEANEMEVRAFIRTTRSSLVWIDSVDAPPRLGLLGGWPTPFRNGRLLVHEISPEEEVVLQAKVELARVPNRVLFGTNSIEVVSPWIRVLGPALKAAGPYAVGFRHGDRARELYAEMVPLDSTCALVSQPDQVLFAIEEMPVGKAALLV